MWPKGWHLLGPSRLLMTKVVSAEWTDELAKVELLRLLKRESDVCSLRMERNNVIVFKISIISLF